MIVVMILSQRVEHGIQEFWQRYAAGADVLQNVQSLCGDVIPCDGVAHKRISLKNNLIQKRAHCNQAKNIDFLDGAAQQKLRLLLAFLLPVRTSSDRMISLIISIARRMSNAVSHISHPPSKETIPLPTAQSQSRVSMFILIPSFLRALRKRKRCIRRSCKRAPLGKIFPAAFPFFIKKTPFQFKE